jgi:hypothetical protein
MARELLEAAAHLAPRVRRWYRDAGIIGPSAETDIRANETTRSEVASAPVRAEDPTADRIEAYLATIPDGWIIVRHHDNESLRSIAHAEGVPYPTIRRRYIRALAQVNHRMDIGRGECGPTRSPSTSALGDVA